MGEKDVISKSIIRQIVMDMANYLLNLEIVHLEEAQTEHQRVEVRHADIVMKAETKMGEQFILHIELQNDNHPEMALRMLRYYTDIALAYSGLPIRQYVIYIGKDKLKMPDGINQTAINYQYQLIDMHKLDCDKFIAEDNPDALILAILCDFKDKDSYTVVEDILKRLIKLTGNQPEKLRNYLKMLETLSTNRDLSDLLNEVEQKMLSEIEIEKLPSYMIGEARGEARGKAEVALRMLPIFEDDKISELTGLPLEQIKQLRQK